MKILIVSHYYKPHVGGIENVVFNQAKQLAKDGHKVTILTSKTGGERSLSNQHGIKILRVKVWNILENTLGIPYPLFSTRLLNMVKSEVATNDVIHIHGHVYVTSVVTAYYAKKLSKKIIITQHNTFIAYKNPLTRLLQHLADKTLGKFTLTNSEKIISVSKETQQYVKSLIKNEKEIRIMYNGIDFQRFNRKVKTSIIKNRLRIKDEFVCFTVRRVTFKNGIDTLLRVAKDLKNKEIVFVIGGTGPDLEKARRYIELNKLNNVRLLGYIPDSELPSYYALADVFILPSKNGEGFPIVVLEAFASGTPVIATKSGGHVEFIKKDKNGFLVEIDNSSQISMAIKYLKRNKAIRYEMGKYSQNLVRNYFTWKKNVVALNKLYKEVAI